LHLTDSSLSLLSGSYSHSTKISPIDDIDCDLMLEVFLKPQDSEDNTLLEDVARALRRLYPKKSQTQTSQDNTNLDLQQ